MDLLAHMNEQHSQLLHQLKRGHGDKRNKLQQVTLHARSSVSVCMLRPDHGQHSTRSRQAQTRNLAGDISGVHYTLYTTDFGRHPRNAEAINAERRFSIHTPVKF